jgi:hypothetical protein
MLCAAILVIVGCTTAAAFYELGRRSVHTDLTQWCERHRCAECAAVPKLTRIHHSGCESGWGGGDLGHFEQFSFPGMTHD